MAKDDGNRIQMNFKGFIELLNERLEILMSVTPDSCCTLDLEPIKRIADRIQYQATLLEMQYREQQKGEIETILNIEEQISLLVFQVLKVDSGSGNLLNEKLFKIVENLVNSTLGLLNGQDSSIGLVYDLISQIQQLPTSGLLLTANLIESEINILQDALEELENDDQSNLDDQNMVKTFVLCFKKLVLQLRQQPLSTYGLRTSKLLLESCRRISALIDDYICELDDGGNISRILEDLKSESDFLLDNLDLKFKELAEQQLMKYLALEE